MLKELRSMIELNMKEQIRLSSKVQYDSVVDGLGLRQVVWTQGCMHHCLHCHNQSTWDFNGGFLEDVDEVIEELMQRKYHTGVTFSGGEPMAQAKQCALIAAACKKVGFNVWSYTGYTIEELLKMNDQNINEFLRHIDVLVDGRFIFEEKSLDCKFRGSKNQRLIDVQKSLKESKTILLDLI